MPTLSVDARWGRVRLGLVILVLGLTACGGSGSSDRPLVIATTSVIADVVSMVVGDSAEVETLMPLGADPHEFEPSARQVARLEDADLVVAVGLDLEESLGDVLQSVESDGVRVLRIGPRVEPDWVGDSVVLDPHVWMDPLRMALAAELVADTLDELGVTGPWQEGAASARSTLEALDAELRSTLEAIPAERRLLVTGHDSLGYFADRYGFEIVGSVVEGGSTTGAPSSADLADLIDLIEQRGITAIFGETTEPSGLLDAIAAEPGLDVVVVELWIGSLGDPGTEAGTYVGMMRTNARLVADGLTR